MRVTWVLLVSAGALTANTLVVITATANTWGDVPSIEISAKQRAATATRKLSYVYSKRNFYQTAPGTLAFLPNVKSKQHVRFAATYFVMKESGAYRLPKRQRYCFVVNHRAPNAGSKTYLGVMVVPFLNLPHSSPTSVFYAKDWVRKNDVLYRRENGKTKVLRIKADEFFQLHSKTRTLAEFDNQLGSKWHGKVSGTNIESWQKRYVWDLSNRIRQSGFLNRFQVPVGRDYHKRIDALLLSFSPTESYRSIKPLSFCISGDNRKAVFLKTFAENSNYFEREYYLTFK